MSWNELIRAAREQKKMTRKEVIARMQNFLPADSSVTVRTLLSWESGDSEPKVTQAIALARTLGFQNVSALFMPDMNPGLNDAGIRKLEGYYQLLMEVPRYRVAKEPTKLRFLPVYLQPASAGTGQWLDDTSAENFEVDDSVPTAAEFGVRLAGDSMEPRFANGQIVWAKHRETAEDGEIVLCYLDGQNFCKRLCEDDEGVRLVSINKKYAPIPVTADSEFRIFGVVVG